MKSKSQTNVLEGKYKHLSRSQTTNATEISFVSSDVNECTEETHNCDVDAVCNNTRGSYNCTCKDGFYGDGINCTGNYL